MALDISLNKQAAEETTVEARPRARTATGAWATVRRVLMPLASLKLTVVLFALAIFLVFAGTLAQKQLDIWEVIHGWFRVDLQKLSTESFPWLNFRELFVRIPLEIFCIDMFFPQWIFTDGPPNTTLGMWFPRGWVIGVFMGLNLLAAHTVRFSVQAKGTRLWAGLGVIALGCLATWAAIVSGSSEQGIVGEAIVTWEVLWKLILLAVTATAFAAGAAVFLLEKHRVVERVACGVTAAVGGGFLVYALFMESGAQLIKPEGMRILWQLFKGGGAGLILLAGCWLVFKKRAGIVLLHSGIGLLFLYELIVGIWHDEAQMMILEGTRSNWVQDIRKSELAFSKLGPTQDEVTVVPQHFLENENETIEDETLKKLPFDIQVVKFIKNGSPRELERGETAIATAGEGVAFTVDELPPSTGVDNESTADMPAMYVRITPKSGDRTPQTYLASVGLTELIWQRPDKLKPDTIKVGDDEYALSLRFKRTYKPYAIEALELKHDKYVGEEKAKGYSSKIHVDAPTMDIDREVTISMNNPMRFAGETFYQSGLNTTPLGKITIFSVVENAGWMLPYVSCMIVGVGMLAQFGIVLLRFLSRAQAASAVETAISTAVPNSGETSKLVERIDSAQTKRKQKGKGSFAPVPRDEDIVTSSGGSRGWNACGSFLKRNWIAIAAVSGVVIFNVYLMSPAKPDVRGMKLAEFGKLPVAYDSRVKPFDALARNAMTRMLDKQSFKLDYNDPVEGPDGKLEKRLADNDPKTKLQPALRWLLDLTTGDEGVMDYQIIRIANDELPKTLDLKDNTHLSYSYHEILSKQHAGDPARGGRKIPELMAQADMVRERGEKRAKNRTPDAWDREVMKVLDRVEIFSDFSRAFRDSVSDLPQDPTSTAAGEKDPRPAFRAMFNFATPAETLEELDRLRRKPPMPVPLADGTWTTVAEAHLLRYFQDPTHAEQFDFVRKNLRAEVDLIKKQAGMVEFTRQMQPDSFSPEDEEFRKQIQVLSLQGDVLVRFSDRLAKFLDAHQEPGKHLGPRGAKFLAILDAYKSGDAGAFNTAVAEYRDVIVADPPSEYDVKRRDWEAFMLRSEPFFWNAWMYLIAFCCAAGAWLGYRTLLNGIAFKIILATFFFNTAALLLRMYVTDRFAPVTNLYSSAVFIGWGGVLLGIIFESVYKNGFGNVVAALSGFGSLMVAWLLERQGDDTIQSLEAVLDTTFWLATHVTCITLGYTTTYVAGFLGAIYILLGVCTPALSQYAGKEVARMTYGTLCFALFFSFVGTVLGGLWADDSWGRFWGWDPKENGALIIVLWNALILHARWDGMIKDRGLAILSVVGNVTTSWSWFGVNQLGVGKHNYGFNKDLMDVLTWFTLASLTIAAIGLLPRSKWLSGDKLAAAK